MPNIIHDLRIDIDNEKVLTSLGYLEASAAPVRIHRMVNELSRTGEYLAEPAYTYTVRNIEAVIGKQIYIEGGIRLQSGVLSRLLKDCREAAIFVCTIGDRLEKAGALLARNRRVLRSSVLDTIGSHGAESIAEFVQGKIQAEAARRGLRISRRFSPGYCDWPVDEQTEIFNALEDDTAGINITEGYLMLPRKSVSGIIGIGTRESGIEDYNPCLKCGKTECPGRRD